MATWARRILLMVELTVGVEAPAAVQLVQLTENSFDVTMFGLLVVQSPDRSRSGRCHDP